MNLDQAQVAKVRQWVEEGRKAAEIQTRLLEELGLKMTYAEVRFLLGDLELRPKDPPPVAVAADSVLTAPGAGSGVGGAAPGGMKTSPLTPAAPAAAGAGPGVGGVNVNMDEIARPGMVVSGKVSFSDGQTGEWGIDQMGRPRLVPATPAYRPSQADLMEFQAQLEQVLSRFGY